MRQTLRFFALSLLLGGAACPPAMAHDRAEFVSVEDDVLTYAPAFFTDFNPQTALDMVNRVPGFSVSGGGGGRGLAGSLGNVLIDGRRPSSKNGVGTLLGRLPAASVVEIQLIRAPIPGIDMAGRDQVVNVITSQSGSWSGAYEARLRVFENERVVPVGEIAATRATANGSLTLALDLSGHADGNEVERRFFLADESFLGVESERNQRSFYDVTPSLGWQRNFEAGHALRVDSRVWAWRFRNTRNGAGLDGFDAPVSFDFAQSQTEAWGTESTVDYDHVFGATWSGKLTGLQRYEQKDESDFFDFFDGDGAFQGRVNIDEAETSGETVLRGEMRRASGDASSLTLAIEGAFNFLDGSVDITEDDGSGPVEIILPVSTTRVEERRVDASAQQIWRLTETLTLDGTMAAEFSEISQTGDAQQERTFIFFKPSASAIWTPNETDQITLSLSRDVGQLSFGEFVSSVNVNDDTTNLGNPDLEPERTWRLQANWERRFWEEGTIRLLVRHEWVEAVADVVPVGLSGDGPGNLGDGTRLRFQINADIPTDNLGLDGGLFSLGGMTRETKVTDPVTGVERRFRNDEDWRLNLNFRQDLPEAGFAWGASYFVQGDEDFYRTSRFERVRSPRGNINGFVERRLQNGLTAEIGANLKMGENKRTRYDWPVTRAEGSPTRIERRSVNEDGVLYFEVSGVF
jgi:hypothetical protein